MIFNSIDFLLFFIIVIPTYYMLPHKYRWILLLLSSYFFYGYWQYKYLLIIIGSTIIDYFVAKKIYTEKVKAKKKLFLFVSLFSNLGILFIFKYYNFFITNLSGVFIGHEWQISELLLPVGISFYTFQTMSYSIDVYNGKVKPENHFGKFALFVSFFPQLVAGPIERASHLLPQFHFKHSLDFKRIGNGLTLILWGLIKKVVIADRLALFTNEIYNNSLEYHGLTFVIATVFFAFQIYCDFSGYSDIAIGTARVLGFDLMKNFRTPYFSASISEFWRRWHISLSTWFRDYLYIPLGGNKVMKWRWYYNILITFLLSGLWHGANWTFIIWGGIHGVFIIFESIFNFSFKLKYFHIVKTFVVVCISWVFFRANSIHDAFLIFENIINIKFYSLDQLSFYIVPFSKNTVYSLDIILSYLFITTLLLFEFLFTKKINFHSLRFRYKLILYLIGLFSLIVLGTFGNNEFIYFQF